MFQFVSPVMNVALITLTLSSPAVWVAATVVTKLWRSSSAAARLQLWCVSVLGIAICLVAVITPTLGQPPAARVRSDPVVDLKPANAVVPAQPSGVTLWVNAKGDYLLNTNVAGTFPTVLDQIKQAGLPLSIRAEAGVTKEKLCSLLATCRRSGVEPAEFAEKDGTPIYHYAGTVVDPEDKPVAGAKLKVSYYSDTPRPANSTSEAITDENGRFEFIRRVNEFVDADFDVWKPSFAIIATKEGFGFGFGSSSFCMTTNRPPETEQLREVAQNYYRGTPTVLRLTLDDTPIHGRVIDTEGKPIANAKIEGANVWFNLNDTLDAWEAACDERDANHSSVRKHARFSLSTENYRDGYQPAVIPTVHTDSDGWFTLRGVGRERIVTILVSRPGIETIQLDARTRIGKTIYLSHGDQRNVAASPTPYYPNEFTVVVRHSVDVIGRLTDSLTGDPVSGVTLRGETFGDQFHHGPYSALWHNRAVTDKDGHYRLSGLPIGKSTFVALPPNGSKYFRASIPVTTPTTVVEFAQDISLIPGVILTGHILDATTGKPARAQVEYFPEARNSPATTAPGIRRPVANASVFWSDSQGRFTIPVLPGSGILGVKAWEHQKYPWGPQAEGPDPVTVSNAVNLVNGPGLRRVSPDDFHFVLPLEIAPDAIAVEREIVLHSGMTLNGRVLSTDGTPLSNYYLTGDTMGPRWLPCTRSDFKITGYFPKSGRRLMAWDSLTNHAGVLNLIGDVSDVVEIKLKPAGKIVGRVVDEQGDPLEGVVLNDIGFGIGELQRVNDFGSTRGIFLTDKDYRSPRTDDQGRFELRGIIPGLSYGVMVGIPRIASDRKSRAMYSLFKDVVVEPGETKDLGDLKPKKLPDPVINPASNPESGDMKRRSPPSEPKPSTEPK